ncbi:MAG: hypothetical protein IK116_01140 [Firmicutes bacterium]|nr:hypothetical protein [Bacillota bacterium]
MIYHFPELLLRCLICTVVIECGLACALGVRRPADQAVVALVNVVTNPPLVSVCLLVQFFCGHGVYLAVLIALEMAAWAAEAWFYRTVLRPKMNPLLLSALLNAASYLGGSLLNTYVF